MAATKDCMCWMGDGWWLAITVGIARSIPTLLVAWASGLWSCLNHVAFCQRKILQNIKNDHPHKWRQLIMHRKSVGWMLRALMIWKAWKGKQTIKGDWLWLAKNPPILKLVFLWISRVQTFWELSHLPFLVVNECFYSVLLKWLFVL